MKFVGIRNHFILIWPGEGVACFLFQNQNPKSGSDSEKQASVLSSAKNNSIISKLKTIDADIPWNRLGASVEYRETKDCRTLPKGLGFKRLALKYLQNMLP